jgi:cathepsin D
VFILGPQVLSTLVCTQGTLTIKTCQATPVTGSRPSAVCSSLYFQPLSHYSHLFAAVTINGQSATLGSGTELLAAIDTGTTLIGAPSDAVTSIYSLIEGSQALTGDSEGFYIYRQSSYTNYFCLSPFCILACDTTVKVTMSFGGKSWAMDPSDFIGQTFSRNRCLGAFFVNSAGSSAPSWIVGDSFLVRLLPVLSLLLVC